MDAIPHEVEKEKAADPGCNEVDFFNRKETAPGSKAAVSSFAQLSFEDSTILIEYVDETFAMGTEMWTRIKDAWEVQSLSNTTVFNNRPGRLHDFGRVMLRV